MNAFFLLCDKALAAIILTLMDLLPVFPIVILAFCLLSIILRKKGYKFSLLHEIAVAVFMLYCAAVFWVTIPFDSLYYSIITGISPLRGGVNIIPFYGIFEILQEGKTVVIVLNILGNIIMFLPLGFFLPLLWGKNSSPKAVLIFGALLSLLIETTQSFSYRGTDIDDVLLNTTGALAGYGSYRLINKLFPRFIFRFRLVRANNL
jgi:glycopeptide antibiotics resistance protein